MRNRKSWRQKARYAKIKEIKDFIKANKQYPSHTFTMTKREFNFISSAISNNFISYRVEKRKGEIMPYKYRIQSEVKEWIELTISN